MAILVVAAVGYLMANAFQAGSSYYLTVSEAVARASQGGLDGRAVRIQGLVDETTLSWDLASMHLSFALVDEEVPARRLWVRYTGARPDGMEGGRTVIVEGTLRAPDRVDASAILVRCPSRYEVEATKLSR